MPIRDEISPLRSGCAGPSVEMTSARCSPIIDFEVFSREKLLPYAERDRLAAKLNKF